MVNNNEHSKMTRSILLSIPILFIIGGPIHFLFDLTGKLGVVGAFVPVNESPWEHLKMAFYPILIWWVIYYFRARKLENFSKEKWIVSAAASVISAPLTIVLFFYSYKGAFGVEYLALDIFSLLLAIAVGQLLGLHIYKYASPGKAAVYVSLGAIVILLLMFVLFTFLPPHIPLLKDAPTGGYGIV